MSDQTAFTLNAGFNANYSANWIRAKCPNGFPQLKNGFNANYSANWIREVDTHSLLASIEVSMLITVQIG